MSATVLPRPTSRRVDPAAYLIPILVVAALAISALTLLWRPALAAAPDLAAALDHILLTQALMPRAATAVLAGACLGLAGALLQRVLRNPIADSSTLGIAAGAQLALTLAVLLAPSLLALSRVGVAFAGAVAATALVLGLGWRRDLDPVAIAIAGMTVSLVAAALGTLFVLAGGDYALSVVIWGAGSLHQQDWTAARLLGVYLAFGGLAAAALLRPLTLINLDDTLARGLGVGVGAARFAALAVAVALAAAVVASVGVIGFVGLAAPALVRLSGVHGSGRRLALAPLVGAALLLLTDGVVQLGGRLLGGDDLMPTGAATGLIGGPLLLVLIARLPARPRPADTGQPAPVARRPGRIVAALALTLALVIAADLVIGRTADGFTLTFGAEFSAYLPLRLPRLIAALAAGAMLGGAGCLVQRLTGNPLAGPEVLGIGAGAGVGLAGALTLVAAPSVAVLTAGSAIGAGLALAVVVWLASRPGFGPEKMLIGGIALGAAALALIAAVTSAGDMRAFLLTLWLAGGTDRLDLTQATGALVAGLVILLPLAALARPLDILPLGPDLTGALGVHVRQLRLILATAAALLTALATQIVGPLGLVGLIAPHLARLAGCRAARHHYPAAVLTGAIVMVGADWLGRVIAHPYQIPVGIMAAVLGGVYLALQVARRHG